MVVIGKLNFLRDKLFIVQYNRRMQRKNVLVNDIILLYQNIYPYYQHISAVLLETHLFICNTTWWNIGAVLTA